MGITVTLSDGRLKTEDIDPNEKVASLYGDASSDTDEATEVQKDEDEAAKQKDVTRRNEIFGDPDELNSVTPRSSSRLLPPHMRTTARAVHQEPEQVPYHSPDMNCLAKDMSFLAAEFLQETSPHAIGELPAASTTCMLC